MSTFNAALKNPSFRVEVWSELGIGYSDPFPNIQGSLLYGDLSASLFLPRLSKAYISSKASPGTTTFFKEIVRLLGSTKEVKVVDEDNAALAHEMGHFEGKQGFRGDGREREEK